jgi:hypothetical protein
LAAFLRTIFTHAVNIKRRISWSTKDDLRALDSWQVQSHPTGAEVIRFGTLSASGTETLKTGNLLDQ